MTVIQIASTLATAGAGAFVFLAGYSVHRFREIGKLNRKDRAAAPSP